MINENLDRYRLKDVSTDNTNNNNNNNNNNKKNDNNNNNNNNNKDTIDGNSFSINDQLLLETILLMIRGETIKYSSYKKKE